MVAKWPLRCTAMTASNSSSLVFANIRSRTIPALLTRTSRPPKLSTAVWIKPSACAQSATFAPLVTASPPAAVISSTTPCAALPPPAGDPSRPTPMSLTTTRAPSAANASACARPMPPPAPVTMTTRPSSKPICDVSLLDCAGVRGSQIVRRFTAAVYLEACAADVGRGVAREKRCGPTDVDGRRQPAQRNVFRDRCDRFLVAVEQFGLFGLDHADDNRVDSDLRRPLDSQCGGEAFDTRLGGAVRTRSWTRPPAAETGDVHDRPATLLRLHDRVGVLGNRERSEQVELDDLSIEVRTRIRGENVRRTTGVVDHDVE